MTDVNFLKRGFMTCATNNHQPVALIPYAIVPIKEMSRTKEISLKILGTAAIVAGIALAIAGSGVTTGLSMTFGITAAIATVTTPIGSALLALSSSSLSNPFTALGCVVLLPTAALAYSLPFVIPAVVGAIPGIALIALGLEMRKKAQPRTLPPFRA
jgi:hypothetical protein